VGGVTTEDATNFEVLYSEVGPRLWRAILAFTGGRRDLTDDVVAEAFVRTIEAGGSVRRPDAYVYRIAFRLAARELRRPATTEDVGGATVQQDPALAELFDALMRLSPGQRAAIFLRYEADLPVADIADLMDTTSGTVRIHLLRGRRKLAAMWGDEVDD
jgi:RNA polymerase sigma-70 factor, ECF subfamily